MNNNNDDLVASFNRLLLETYVLHEGYGLERHPGGKVMTLFDGKMHDNIFDAKDAIDKRVKQGIRAIENSLKR